ncbi:LOW QUALITY PROTEIN: hypothetical protein Ct61P_14598 [Colletotrichum tofieldiae]|nr:LOW QUALITY PROTEIN: hypothetical protein Ct61P_14598 [Colletotrichum tofieldiae]
MSNADDSAINVESPESQDTFSAGNENEEALNKTLSLLCKHDADGDLDDHVAWEKASLRVADAKGKLDDVETQIMTTNRKRKLAERGIRTNDAKVTAAIENVARAMDELEELARQPLPDLPGDGR